MMPACYGGKEGCRHATVGRRDAGMLEVEDTVDAGMLEVEDTVDAGMLPWCRGMPAC